MERDTVLEVGANTDRSPCINDAFARRLSRELSPRECNCAVAVSIRVLKIPKADASWCPSARACRRASIKCSMQLAASIIAAHSVSGVSAAFALGGAEED